MIDFEASGVRHFSLCLGFWRFHGRPGLLAQASSRICLFWSFSLSRTAGLSATGPTSCWLKPKALGRSALGRSPLTAFLSERRLLRASRVGPRANALLGGRLDQRVAYDGAPGPMARRREKRALGRAQGWFRQSRVAVGWPRAPGLEGLRAAPGRQWPSWLVAGRSATAPGREAQWHFLGPMACCSALAAAELCIRSFHMRIDNFPDVQSTAQSWAGEHEEQHFDPIERQEGQPPKRNTSA